MRHNNKDHHRHPLHHLEHDDDGLDEDDRPLSDASSFGGVVEDASGTTVEVRLRDKQRVSEKKIHRRWPKKDRHLDAFAAGLFSAKTGPHGTFLIIF